jgi:hypothetical protein
MFYIVSITEIGIKFTIGASRRILERLTQYKLIDLIMPCKRKHLIRNHRLKTSQNQEGNDHYRKPKGNTGYSNPMDGSGETSRLFKTDSFCNEVGKVQ